MDSCVGEPAVHFDTNYDQPDTPNLIGFEFFLNLPCLIMCWSIIAHFIKDMNYYFNN